VPFANELGGENDLGVAVGENWYGTPTQKNYAHSGHGNIFNLRLEHKRPESQPLKTRPSLWDSRTGIYKFSNYKISNMWNIYLIGFILVSESEACSGELVPRVLLYDHIPAFGSRALFEPLSHRTVPL
jgi:hypothetical protein